MYERLNLIKRLADTYQACDGDCRLHAMLQDCMVWSKEMRERVNAFAVELYEEYLMEVELPEGGDDD